MSRPAPFTERLARGAARHPLLAVIVWLAIAVACGAAYAAWGDVLVSTDDFLTQPESKQVERLVEDRLPLTAADTEVVVVEAGTGSGAQTRKAVVRRTSELAGRIAAIGKDDVADVRAPDGGKATRALLSKDGRSALVLVTLAGSASDADAHVEPLYDLVRQADGKDGFSVTVTGSATWGLEAQQLAESDLRRAELIGVPIALVILLLVFGAVAAALLPLALAVVAIAVASALTVAMGAWFEVSVFAMNIVTVMGLAVGIDYSLLIVSRFREERRAGLTVADALARAGGTASRAVFFSGGIVVLALTGLLIVPYSIFTSLGAGAIFVVVAAVAAALTLLPAGLRLLGDRVDWGRLPLRHRQIAKAGDGAWTRAARAMMRRPVLALVAGCALLLLLAAPALDMKTGMTGLQEFPDYTSAKRAYEVLRRDFTIGLGSPILVTFQGDLADQRTQALLKNADKLVASDGRFTVVGYETAEDGDLVVLELAVNADATSGAAMDAVTYLREEAAPLVEGVAPVEVMVGGVPALYTDAIEMIEDVHALGHRRRARLELRPAPDRLPIARHRRPGDRHEPALGGRGLRSRDAGLPAGRRRGSARASRRSSASSPGCRC